MYSKKPYKNSFKNLYSFFEKAWLSILFLPNEIAFKLFLVTNITKFTKYYKVYKVQNSFYLAYRKNETWDLGLLQVALRDLGPETSKFLGETWDSGLPERDPDPKIFKWVSGPLKWDLRPGTLKYSSVTRDL